MTDSPGAVWAPRPVAPVHATAMALLPTGLQALKKLANKGGCDRSGAALHLDGGVASAHQRTGLVKAGLSPNINATPRHRKTTTRGRHRFFKEALHALRRRVERTLAWEETFQRLRLRCDPIQHRHDGMKLMAYTVINLREFCGT